MGYPHAIISVAIVQAYRTRASAREAKEIHSVNPRHFRYWISDDQKRAPRILHQGVLSGRSSLCRSPPPLE